jgi:hypothetical protein
MILRELKDENVDDYVYDILKEFDEKIKTWKLDVSLKGKNITIANIEQAAYLARYDQIKVDLKSLLSYYDMQVKKSRGEILQTIYQHSTIDYSASEKNMLIDSNPAYLKYKQIHLDIEAMYSLLASISEQFKNRAYTLNNLVKIYTASLQDITLDVDNED